MNPDTLIFDMIHEKDTRKKWLGILEESELSRDGKILFKIILELEKRDPDFDGLEDISRELCYIGEQNLMQKCMSESCKRLEQGLVEKYSNKGKEKRR